MRKKQRITFNNTFTHRTGSIGLADFNNDSQNELFFSSASLREIAIKNTLGRTDFQINARVLRRGLLDNEYQELPITSEHAVMLENLPAIHKDPFDRILISQATVKASFY